MTVEQLAAVASMKLHIEVWKDEQDNADVTVELGVLRNLISYIDKQAEEIKRMENKHIKERCPHCDATLDDTHVHPASCISHLQNAYREMHQAKNLWFEQCEAAVAEKKQIEEKLAEVTAERDITRRALNKTEAERDEWESKHDRAWEKLAFMVGGETALEESVDLAVARLGEAAGDLLLVQSDKNEALAKLAKVEAENERLVRILDQKARDMHPKYGPCDAFGENGRCAACENTVKGILNELVDSQAREARFRATVEKVLHDAPNAKPLWLAPLNWVCQDIPVSKALDAIRRVPHLTWNFEANCIGFCHPDDSDHHKDQCVNYGGQCALSRAFGVTANE